MPEITDAGMYKEWWANPAVVGLMGFATTTMATGLHNVGYGRRPDAGVGNRLRGHGAVRCGSHRPSERKHLRRIRLHELRRLLVGDICCCTCSRTRASKRVPTSSLVSSSCGRCSHFPFASPPCAWVSISSILFWLLLLAFLLLDGVTLGIVPAALAGWEIFVVGLLAWYIASATLVNTVYGRTVLPLS